MLPVQKKVSISSSLVLGEEDFKVDDVDLHENIVADEVKIDLDDVLADIRKIESNDTSVFIDEIKLQDKIAKFEKSFEKILSTLKYIKPTDKDQLDVIFRIVCQAIEDTIYLKDKDKCNKIKHDIAVKLLKPFVKNDETLCNTIIDMTLKTIKKSSVFRRLRRKVTSAIFFLVSIVCHSK